MPIASDDYRAFQARHTLWLRALRGDYDGDPHAIVPNLIALTWKIACFRLILRGRELASRRNPGYTRLSPLVHGLLDRTFVDAVLMGVRRLVGSRSSRNPESLEDPKRGTYSVSALLFDLEAHRCLVTREHLLQLDGLPLDADAVRHAKEEFLHQTCSVSGEAEWVKVPPYLNWSLVEGRHLEIDWLCCVPRKDRRASDFLHSNRLSALRNHVHDATESVHVWADKYIAHIASPESRATVLSDQVTLRFSDLWKAHEALCRVVATLDAYVLSRNTQMFLPLPLPSDLAYLDEPLLDAADLPELRAFRRQMEKDFQGLSEIDRSLFEHGPKSAD